MTKKSILKFGVAFGLLAILLIFLGVNYVPSISALSSPKGSIGDASIQARPDYNNERFPRSISPQRFYTASDFLNHHPFSITQQVDYTGSDYIERHPSNYYTYSDWIERQP
jgi:hypothetical protein